MHPKFEHILTAAPKNMPQCSATIHPNNVSYTLVTQLDYHRLPVMQQHCLRWSRGISLAVLTDEHESTIRTKLDEMGCRGGNINLSILRAQDYSPDEYPVNTLRNIAIRKVTTSHFLYIDADFLLSKGANDVLKTWEVKQRLTDPKQAIVLPAFQLKYKCSSKHEGSNTACAEVSVFDSSGNPHGHSSTNYDRWMNQSIASLVDIPCIKSERYEPYLVMRRCREMPSYQEAFTGYGWNKISFTLHLQRVGYKFAQLGGVHLVHVPHDKSSSNRKWRRDRRAKDELKSEFKRWLSEQPNQERTPRCASME